MFLSSICLENLIPVSFGIKRLDDIKLRQPINVSYKTKNIRTIALDLNIYFYFFKLILRILYFHSRIQQCISFVHLDLHFLEALLLQFFVIDQDFNVFQNNGFFLDKIFGSQINAGAIFGTLLVLNNLLFETE